MKKSLLLAATLLACAGYQSARAIPSLDVYFTQYNWEVDLYLTPIDNGNDSVEFLVDGNHVGGSKWGIHWGGLMPEDRSGDYFFLETGTHIPSMILDGVEYFGASYTVAPTVGDRPIPPYIPTPDTGSTAALAIASCAMIGAVKRFT